MHDARCTKTRAIDSPRRCTAPVAVWGRASALLTPPSSGLLRPCGDQHGERVPIEPRADPDAHVGQTRVLQHPRELVVVEAEHPVAETIAHPLLIVPAQIEDEDPPAGFQ